MNSNISNIHLEILDSNRQEVLEKILPLAEDYVLGGGTALALQLAHRKSFDFDFFSASAIPKNLLEKLSQIISVKSIVVDSPDELTFFTENNIKLTFLNYPFPRHFDPIKLENGLSIFETKEIALQKAYTIGRRGEYRDYFDLYTILKDKHISLDELILTVKKTYGSVFDEKLFMEQLVYFGDLLNYDVIPNAQEALPKPEEVKRFFEEIVAAHTS